MEKLFEFWSWNSLFYQGMIPKTLGVHDLLKCQPPNSKIQTLCKPKNYMSKSSIGVGLTFQNDI
jgi:hypothetical protein